MPDYIICKFRRNSKTGNEFVEISEYFYFFLDKPRTRVHIVYIRYTQSEQEDR